jgi:hypothetical protein
MRGAIPPLPNTPSRRGAQLKTEGVDMINKKVRLYKSCYAKIHHG